MRQAAVVLMVVAVVIASPVLTPIAMALHRRDTRRMQAAVTKSRCDDCGAILGIASWQRAGSLWAAHVAAQGRDNPTIRFRLVRSLYAVCGTCEAQYGFDATLRTFPRLPEPLT
jgi:hypothetical protein